MVVWRNEAGNGLTGQVHPGDTNRGIGLFGGNFVGSEVESDEI